MKRLNFLRHLRKIILLIRHGKGKEYWVVKARRDHQVVIIGFTEDRIMTQKLAFNEGSNFVSINRLYCIEL